MSRYHYGPDWPFICTIIGTVAVLVGLVVVAGVATTSDMNENAKKDGFKTAVAYDYDGNEDCLFHVKYMDVVSEGMWLAGCYEAVAALRTR